MFNIYNIEPFSFYTSSPSFSLNVNVRVYLREKFVLGYSLTSLNICKNIQDLLLHGQIGRENTTLKSTWQ